METSTKYLVDENKLYISFVNRYDTNLSISCKTQEEMGLSSLETTTLQVTCTYIMATS